MKLPSNHLLTTILLLIAAMVLAFNQAPIKDEKATSLTWRQSLPKAVQESILWCADHEEGTLFDWEYDGNRHTKGGGIFCTGTQSEAIATIDRSNPLTGKYCAKATIHNAFQSKHGSKAVRLMRRTDKPWDQGGKFFPKSAYYGVWMRLDCNYSSRNRAKAHGGWWNVFQFKSDDKSGESQPVWVLNIGNDRQTDKMHFYLYTKHNRPKSISQKNPIPIPVSRWFHVEALYKQSTSNTSDGSLSVWQDGKLILSANNVKTVLAEKTKWGVGNYTDHITGGDKPGSATIFFDDATVATKPTHPYVANMLKLQR